MAEHVEPKRDELAGIDPATLATRWLDAAVTTGVLVLDPLTTVPDANQARAWGGQTRPFPASQARLLRRLIAARIGGDAAGFARTVARLDAAAAPGPRWEAELAGQPAMLWAGTLALLLGADSAARPVLVALAALESRLACDGDPAFIDTAAADRAWRRALSGANADAMMTLIDSAALGPAIEDLALFGRDAPERIGEILDHLAEGRLPFAIDWREDSATRRARRDAARLVTLAILALAAAAIAAAGVITAAGWTPFALGVVAVACVGVALQWRRD
jgi:hypothetical protein